MDNDSRTTVELGELIVAAFDEAARHSADPRQVRRQATGIVFDLLRRARRPLPRTRADTPSRATARRTTN